MKESLISTLELFGAMSPYLLFGFLVAGILHAFVPRVLYVKYLSGENMHSVLLAALMGVPLPLCSCGVIPTAMSMRREGASRSATVSFLISTPQTGVDSIAATASLLGLPFALMRPIAAFVTALFGGALTALFADKQSNDVAINSSQSNCRGFLQRCGAALKYGFYDMIQDVGKWLVIGLLIAGVITLVVPDDFFTFLSSYPLLNMLLVLVISAPMYLCATGSVPIAAALILKGLSPGAAFVLLMAGPATNMAAMLVIGKVLGKKSLALYLLSIIVGAFSFGLLIDLVLPAAWFSVDSGAIPVVCCDSGLSIVEIISSVLFALLLVIAFIGKYRKQKNRSMENSYTVKGMMCNHCKANVEKHLMALDGVEAVSIDLATATVNVTGDVPAEIIAKTVTDLGYEFVE